jgi:hypothetical protein
MTTSEIVLLNEQITKCEGTPQSIWKKLHLDGYFGLLSFNYLVGKYAKHIL